MLEYFSATESWLMVVVVVVVDLIVKWDVDCGLTNEFMDNHRRYQIMDISRKG